MLWLLLLLNVVVTVGAENGEQRPCTLPPDFWCDSPSIAIACTGSLKYCDAYKQSRIGKPVQIHLAFESACPDSQRFVVDRMYSQVLNNSYISQFVDFKAYPYGLAKRETAEKITCHHGERECRGNRLLTCMISQYAHDTKSQSEILYCFMGLMFNKKQDPEVAIQACLRKSYASLGVMQSIIACSRGHKATALQRFDEMETQKILSMPRFVPFIQINGHSNIEMQAYQMILTEKLQAWNKTLQRIIPITAPNLIDRWCQVPSEFWCSDSSITNQCFYDAGCKRYYNAIYGQPIHLKIIYSDSQASRNYILGYVKSHFLLGSALSRKQIENKVTIELEPSASERNLCGYMSCDYQAVQHCVATHVKPDIQTRNRMLLCLLETGGDMIDGWIRVCHTFNPGYKDIVMQCVKSDEWRREVRARAQVQSSLYPEPKGSDFWIVVNGYSLSTVQPFANIIDRLICLWFRGPNHDRTSCFRCEYEMTHCYG